MKNEQNTKAFFITSFKLKTCSNEKKYHIISKIIFIYYYKVFA